jgi:EF hand
LARGEFQPQKEIQKLDFNFLSDFYHFPQNFQSGVEFLMLSRMRLIPFANPIKMMKTTIHTFSLLFIATSLSFAQPPAGPDGQGKPPRPSPEKMFEKIDANSDGNVTLEEFQKGPRAQKNEAKAAEIFAKIDANSDGNITLEEFKSHRPDHKPPGKQGKGKGKGDKNDAPPAGAPPAGAPPADE